MTKTVQQLINMCHELEAAIDDRCGMLNAKQAEYEQELNDFDDDPDGNAEPEHVDNDAEMDSLCEASASLAHVLKHLKDIKEPA